jgi:WD40 repeat protein
VCRVVTNGTLRSNIIELSPDYLSVHVHRIVRLWCCETLTEFRQLRGHTRGVASLTFHPDGSVLASGSGDGTLRLWKIIEDDKDESGS